MGSKQKNGISLCQAGDRPIWGHCDWLSYMKCRPVGIDQADEITVDGTPDISQSLFSKVFTKKTLHSSSVRPRYGLSFVCFKCIFGYSSAIVIIHAIPDSKVHVANMGPTWVLAAPGGPHIGPMNLAIRDAFSYGSTLLWGWLWHVLLRQHSLLSLISNFHM